MRRGILLLLALLPALLLCACGEAEGGREQILVSLEESSYYTVEENGIQIYPGQTVCFSLRMRSGAVLSGTDYPGEHYIWEDEGKTYVELWNVAYPTQVKLEVTDYYRRILYDPNGGTGSRRTGTYDITHHLRPNTAIGTDIYSREGHTLVAWNTAADGSGTRVGLGSRVSVPEEGLTLYAQWAQWTEASAFTYIINEGTVTVTGYLGGSEDVVIPERIEGLPVTAIAAGAFQNAPIRSVVLPATLVTLEAGAFSGSSLESVLLFDNIETLSDAAFDGCRQLRTLHINAVEAPYGYLFRRESMFADKIDLLIENQGNRKLVCYGGCSMWYNMDGPTVQNAMKNHTVINVAINGTVNSLIQMQIIGTYLEEGDLFFHTPELTSNDQLLITTGMDKNDARLWCGLENNYDLVALADIRGIDGFFDSFCSYLSRKTEEATYQQIYTDSQGRLLMDETGSVPFVRTEQVEELAETSTVFLDPVMVETMDLTLLEGIYQDYMSRGVRIYLSYSCFDYDALSEEEQGYVGAVDAAFHRRVEAMNGPVLISTLWDFLYVEENFYDSAYHLLTPAVERNTAVWIRDLLQQMEKDQL